LHIIELQLTKEEPSFPNEFYKKYFAVHLSI